MRNRTHSGRSSLHHQHHTVLRNTQCTQYVQEHQSPHTDTRSSRPSQCQSARARPRASAQRAARPAAARGVPASAPGSLRALRSAVVIAAAGAALSAGACRGARVCAHRRGARTCAGGGAAQRAHHFELLHVHFSLGHGTVPAEPWPDSPKQWTDSYRQYAVTGPTAGDCRYSQAVDL